MEFTNLERYLESYGKYVVQQSKSNLTKAKKNVSKDLYNSIKYKIEFSNGEFSSINPQFYTPVDRGSPQYSDQINIMRQIYNALKGANVVERFGQ